MRRVFQSPYGGRGRSDGKMTVGLLAMTGFNHLTVAGVGQTTKRVTMKQERCVSITLRWQG